MQATDGLEFGYKIKKLACHHGLPGKDNSLGLVGKLAQGHHIFGELRTVLDAVPRFKPCHGLGYQRV